MYYSKNRRAIKRFTYLVVLAAYFSACSWFDEHDNQLDEGEPIPNTDLFMPLGLYDIRGHEAHVSPDGKWMLWDQTYSDTLPQGIYIMDLQTYESRVLFESPFAGFPEWSADGQKIVFWNDQYIYTMKANGDSVILLTHGHFPDWSSDGEWIVFDRSLPSQEGPDGMFLMKSNGTQLHWFRHGNIPQWNKTTNEILYIRGDPNLQGEWWFHVYNFITNTEDDSSHISSAGGTQSYQLSPDGKKIIYSDIYGIWVLDRKSKQRRKIVRNDMYNGTIQKGDEYIKQYVSSPTWCPDSKHFVYARFEIQRIEHSDYEGLLIEGWLSFYKASAD